MITVRYYAPIRGIIGLTEETLDVKTVDDIAQHIKKTYGKEAYKAARSALVVVNDVSISQFRDWKTKLKSGDTVGFLPLCGGG